jgi:SAM-dependent methyltransferase
VIIQALTKIQALNKLYFESFWCVIISDTYAFNPLKYMQFHECPERAIVNILKEAFRLLRPGGTIVVSDQSVSINAYITLEKT